jgi:hypothetical protein
MIFPSMFKLIFPFLLYAVLYSLYRLSFEVVASQGMYCKHWLELPIGLLFTLVSCIIYLTLSIKNRHYKWNIIHILLTALNVLFLIAVTIVMLLVYDVPKAEQMVNNPFVKTSTLSAQLFTIPDYLNDAVVYIAIFKNGIYQKTLWEGTQLDRINEFKMTWENAHTLKAGPVTLAY